MSPFWWQRTVPSPVLDYHGDDNDRRDHDKEHTELQPAARHATIGDDKTVNNYGRCFDDNGERHQR